MAERNVSEMAMKTVNVTWKNAQQNVSANLLRVNR